MKTKKACGFTTSFWAQEYFLWQCLLRFSEQVIFGEFTCQERCVNPRNIPSPIILLPCLCGQTQTRVSSGTRQGKNAIADETNFYLCDRLALTEKQKAALFSFTDRLNKMEVAKCTAGNPPLFSE